MSQWFTTTTLGTGKKTKAFLILVESLIKEISMAPVVPLYDQNHQNRLCH